MADEGCTESALPRPSPTVCDGPPVPEGGGYSWDNGFCDFAFGSAQNDRVGGILRRVKFFGLGKPTERKPDAVCIVIGLMLCRLFLG